MQMSLIHGSTSEINLASRGIAKSQDNWKTQALYHGWASQESGLGKPALPISIASWKKMMKSLKLPSSYALNIADRKHVPPQVVIQDASTQSPVGRLFRGIDSQALMLKQVAFVKVLLFSTLS
jgi:hypothetical protein